MRRACVVESATPFGLQQTNSDRCGKSYLKFGTELTCLSQTIQVNDLVLVAEWRLILSMKKRESKEGRERE